MKKSLFLKVIRQDFDAHAALLFLVITIIALLLLKKPATIIGVAIFALVPLFVLMKRYYFISNLLKKGKIVNASIEKLLQPAARKTLVSLRTFDADAPRGLYFMELKYSLGGNDYDTSYRFSIFKNMPSLTKGEELELLVDPNNPEVFIVKKFWITDTVELGFRIQ